MIQLSRDLKTAERQMRALIFYLLAFGYIDGDFDDSERAFILETIEEMTRRWSKDRVKDPVRRAKVIERFEARFKTVFKAMNRYIEDLFTESVTDEETLDEFVYTKLKLRTFELFYDFDRDNQERLLNAASALILADNVIHPAEVQFREELEQLLQTLKEDEAEATFGTTEDLSLVIEEANVSAEKSERKTQEDDKFFRPMEQHFAANTTLRGQQVAADCELIHVALSTLETQGKKNKGRLKERHRVDEFATSEPFLDQRVQVIWPQQDQDYELLVLGDLHGCYSCLKAALIQSDFVQKVRAFKSDPANNPDTKLVLLGDYIDRGFFSFNGVLRTILRLFAEFPEHVVMLRGNHEHYVERDGVLISKVVPAEAMKRLTAHLPRTYFDGYKLLFERMPTVAFFERIMFVHGGIPRDNVFHAGWRGLSSLNSPRIGFQMRWSDPSDTDRVPNELQVGQTRFSFGQSQFERFMSRVGCHTMIRGHERVFEGIKTNYHRNGFKLVTLFSAGGSGNNDLPERSSYRRVTPRAMTIYHRNGALSAQSWPLDYERFNDPEHNAFFQDIPDL